MRVPHEPWLVVLSLVVAIQGAYVGLSLAVQVARSFGARRRILLAAAAISLAVAIWAMHFVGMLAARLPFPVDYLVFPTLLSFLVCVLVVGGAVFAASTGLRTPTHLAAAAAFMGCGIASMHYLGMMALHASAHMEHDAVLVAASVLVGIGASGLALWLAGSNQHRPQLLLSATALGLAITGMHYTAMAGLTLHPVHGAAPVAPALSPDLLAIVVAIVAFLVSAGFLLALVPDRDTAPTQQPTAPAALASLAPMLAVPGGAGPIAVPAAGFEPIAAPAPLRRARHLPIERDGATHYLSIDDIVAVHANAHYTYVFDGSVKLFCPLAIGDVESQLDAARFVRVHRSHIVNLGRVIGIRRAGDHGLIELSAAERYTVPVSRSRFGDVKSRLGSAAGEAVS